MTGGSRGRPQVEKWLEGCREALDLTRQQGEAIAAEDYLRLEGLLEERGRILAALGDLREMTWEGDELSTNARWAEVLQLLQEIADLDEGHQRAIAARLQSLRGDFKEVEKWRQAARAYGGGRAMPDRGVKA